MSPTPTTKKFTREQIDYHHAQSRYGSVPFKSCRPVWGDTIRHGFALGPLGESMVLDKGVRLIVAAPVRAARRCLSFLLLLHLLLWLLLLLLLRLFLCLLLPLLLPTATPSCHTQALHPHPVSK